MLTYVLAYFAGILFNLNPSCGSASLIWISTQTSRLRLAALATIRITVFVAIGTIAGLVGNAARLPWGIGMIIAGGYVLYTTISQIRSAQANVCVLPRHSRWLPLILAVTPPPSAYIGLAIFFGGFNVPSPTVGALTLAMVGFGLTTPVWMVIARPKYKQWWFDHFLKKTGSSRFQTTYQLAGALILISVGLLFVTLNNFHRPLLEVLHS